MHLYSCHDITLIPMREVLKCFSPCWPAYCSHITFELWQDKVGKYWVNLIHGNKVRILLVLAVMYKYKLQSMLHVTFSSYVLRSMLT